MTTEKPVRHATGIQWTHHPGYVGATWNPSVGCTRVSPGCDNCYAFTLHDQRYAANLRATRDSGLTALPGPAAISFARAQGVRLPLPPQYDRPFSQVQLLDDERLTAPLRAKRPHAYFVDSMADLFHEDVPDEFLDRVFAVMALSPRHLFMVLTKRPERMREYLTAGRSNPVGMATLALTFDALSRDPKSTLGRGIVLTGDVAHLKVWPLPNVALGVSAEDQQRADERIPLLLDTPAAVHFISYEPALGPLTLRAEWLWPRGHVNADPHTPEAEQALRELVRAAGKAMGVALLDWVIVGGESGSRARPFDLAWARAIVEQCRMAGLAPFVKQLGAKPHTNPAHRFGQDWLRLRNRHGADMAEWPVDLRVREFPPFS